MPALAESVSDLARLASVKACLEWFRKERGWINEQHLKLCRIPAPTFLENQARRVHGGALPFSGLGVEAGPGR